MFPVVVVVVAFGTAAYAQLCGALAAHSLPTIGLVGYIYEKSYISVVRGSEYAPHPTKTKPCPPLPALFRTRCSITWWLI